jgi:hypothetical protein
MHRWRAQRFTIHSFASLGSARFVEQVLLNQLSMSLSAIRRLLTSSYRGIAGRFHSSELAFQLQPSKVRQPGVVVSVL